MTPLENRIWSWLDNVLSIPRQEFNGQPACPYINKYRDRIAVKEVEQGVKVPIEQAVQMFVPLQYMAICLAFPRKPPISSINRVVEEILNKKEYDDIEILINNHRLKGPVRGVYTGFAECDLVIIQSKTKLKFARLNLKKTGYYK